MTTWLEEACIAEEAARDSRMATNMTQPLMHTLAQAAEIIGRGIGQDGVVQMIPERLNGIEFGRIGWEPFGVEPGAAGLDGLLHQAATMGGQTIPQQDDGFTPMAGQRPKKLYQMGRSDAAGMYGQQPAQAAAVGAGKHCGDPGQPLPIEGLTDHWCTAPWRPRGPNGRALRKARFVQENQPGVQARGLFFTWGQRDRTQWAIAFSSRSLAWRAGRCRLHPNWPRIRQTWAGEWRTRQVFQITSATRCKVHNSVAKPQALAPFSSAAATRCRAMASSRGVRPARPAPRNPCRPWLRQAAYQRLAVGRLTPNRRATSACLSPCSNHLPAVIRRASRALKSRCRRSGEFIPSLYHNGGHDVTIL